MLAAAALIMAAALCPANLLYLVPQKLHGNPRGAYRAAAERILSKTEPDARVFLFTDKPGDDYHMFISYYANELMISKYHRGVYGYDYDAHPELLKDVLGHIAEHDYVYAVGVNDNLRTHFSDYVADGELTEGKLYRVEVTDGKVTLHEV